MTRAERLALALFALLALAAGALVLRLARRLEHGGAWRVELGAVRATTLSPATLAAFEALGEPVSATYYVSPPARMPAELRRMQLEVTDLLAALRARFPERFEYRVVDPESGEGLAGFAARRQVAPFTVRSVTRDAWDERTVYSTLALGLGARAEARLDGLTAAQLPVLQAWIAATLAELAHPRAPRLALAATADEGASFEELADLLATRGPLARVELDAGAEPPECDVLFWLNPRAVSGAQLRALERRLAAGTSVVLAGSAFEAREEVRGGSGEETPWVSFRPKPSAFAELAAHFGLALEPALVLDRNCEELEFGGRATPTPYWLRSIAPDQDFRRFVSQPNGTLLFRAASPLVPLPDRLAELGWTPEVLATTSDASHLVHAPPRAPIELARLAPGEAVAKQPLLVALRHADPWHGLLVLAAAETPFADGFLRREHFAHPRLIEVLLEETTSSARRVKAGLALPRPEPLPAFGAGARLAWRAVAIALPVALLLLGVHGRALFGWLAGGLRRARGTARRALVPAALLAGALGLVQLVRGRDVGLDLSASGRNSLAPAARAVAARARAGGPIAATLVLSAPAQLPPPLRAPLRALEERLADFARAGAPLQLVRFLPEELEPDARAAWAARGVAMHAGASDDDGVTRVVRYAAALVLARDGRELVLDFPDARSAERLEFRLALALERLAGRNVPRVAFASDVPRLSAAEAYEQFQQKGLFAPRGTDVFAAARAALARQDLELVHVNPRAPEPLAPADVLVWLQPRRSIEVMLEETVRHLVGGGRALIAAQHFELRAQQFRGGDFAPKHWPQPQTPDLERLYFPELGIELVREVLFDELCLAVAADSQLTGRRAGRDFERQTTALPFQIRLSAAGYAPLPWLRGLGDQAFLWANRLRWDEARLAALGLTATPLASSSPRTWSFTWEGGWVPDELLRGPAALPGSSGAYLGPQPLVALFEGTFPRPTKPLWLAPAAQAAESSGGASPEGSGGSDAAPPEPERPWPASAPGRLLLLGDAHFLENESLASDEFRGDQLLFNLVAGLAFEGELGELALRVDAPRGFGWVSPKTRLALRAAAVAGGPLVLVALAGALAFARRRPPRPRGVA